MKKIQQLFVAGVFTLALATAASGGQIDTGGRTEPPPPPASASAPTSGEILGDAKDDGHDYQLMEDIALGLLRTMLSVF